MLHTLRCPWTSTHRITERAAVRYGLIRRVHDTASCQGAQVLAFAVGRDELRLVVEGSDDAVRNVLRGVKVGTRREVDNLGGQHRWRVSDHRRIAESQLTAAIGWVHSLPVAEGAAGPLASPWSSHRDLLGYRRASFYDSRAVLDRVDLRTVHTLAGGTPAPLRPAMGPTTLDRLLRVAAAAVGVLPADRQCFRLFVHLARSCGWRTADLAAALMLTARRIRQLASVEEPMLQVALATLGDARLATVP